MRILVATNLFPPVVSGTSSYAADVCRALAQAGQRVLLMVPEGLRPARPADYGIERAEDILELPCLSVPRSRLLLGFGQLRSVHRPGTTGRVVRFLREQGVEFVYQQSHAFDTAFYTLQAARRTGIGRAICHHTNIGHPNRVFNAGVRAAERWLVRPLHLNGRDLWICPDQFTIRYCQQRFPDMPRAQVSYAVSPLPATTDPAAIGRARTLRQRHDPLLLSVGHVTSCRDRTDLIEAIARLKPDYPRIGLMIVGDVQVSHPVALAASRGLSDHVHFLGAQPKTAVRAYAEAADLEGHWYFDASTFGLATLELMATGLCCLSTCPPDCYGADLFREGEHYARVRGGDPAAIASTIQGLLADPDRRRRIGRAAEQLVREHLSWEVSARRLVEAFDRHRTSLAASRRP